MMQQLIQKVSTKAPNLFLFDGLGALLSAFMLAGVLVYFEPLFGIPKTTLYFLAILPCIFALYDFYAYFNSSKNKSLFLKGIAVANTAYCMLSLGLAIYHFQQITYLGWIYVILEIVIVLSLAIFEYKVAEKI